MTPPTPTLRWRVVYDPPRSGALNMALDESLARALSGETAILRLYGWLRPTVSFGRNEPARGLYSGDAAAAAGVDLVRRPTGGRAVVHDREVTYAVVAPIRAMGGARAAYRLINEALGEAMRSLGAGVELAGDSTPPGPPARPAPPPSAGPAASTTRWSPASPPAFRSSTLPLDAGPCFQSPAAGEVVALGRKLIGSAQARIGGAVLQHGSIILSGDQSILAALNPDAAGFERPATLEELVGPLDFDVVARAAASGMERCFGGSWIESALESAEIEAANGLVESRYGRPEWTWRR